MKWFTRNKKEVPYQTREARERGQLSYLDNELASAHRQKDIEHKRQELFRLKHARAINAAHSAEHIAGKGLRFVSKSMFGKSHTKIKHKRHRHKRHRHSRRRSVVFYY